MSLPAIIIVVLLLMMAFGFAGSAVVGWWKGEDVSDGDALMAVSSFVLAMIFLVIALVVG